MPEAEPPVNAPTIRRAGSIPFAALLGVLLTAKTAASQVVMAEPSEPIVAQFPAGTAAVETQVVVQVVVDAAGGVESALEVSRLPRDVPDTFARAAVDAVKAAKFTPSSRDGRPIRSRIEYVVVFRPAKKNVALANSRARAPSSRAPSGGPAQTPSATVDSQGTQPLPMETVDVRGIAWSSPRGLGDFRIDRETLTASPRQQTSEMLSSAPGFFVDHEDGESLGNDVYLRGFDLDNGSGIEMKVGEVPINIPLHVHGQGYADSNFIIPEVVRSIRVLEGSYDPRQGDAAIAGSAAFDLGVPERGYQLKTSYGSFGQARVVGIAAPTEMSDETFVAFSLRSTQGFGADRASKSASLNAQYGADLGENDHLRVLTTAYAATETLPGVVREDDVDAGRIGYYDSYPYFSSAQGAQAERLIAGAQLDHAVAGGAHFEIAPWVMWTSFTSRQNYTGDILSSNLQPQIGSLGDLWQLTNVETAWGVAAHVRTAPVRIGNAIELVVEPGTSWRAGHTTQGKDLVNPADLAPWDLRASYGLDTVDLGAYLDLDIRLWKRFRVSGGMRADFLDVSITNNLAGVVSPIPAGALQGLLTHAVGIAPGPRVTVAYEISPELTPMLSAGEGFRSLDAGSLTSCNGPCAPGLPYSNVASFEGGLRSEVAKGRFTTVLAVYQTDVGNELVFEAASGGLTTEGASTRRGMVSSLLARPNAWLTASSALSVQSATFNALGTGTSHFVPNVPSVLWRTDLNVHGELFRFRGAPITGRVGVGYTLLAGRHVNDAIVSPTNNVFNGLVSFRYRIAEIGLDMYNVLGLKYADEEETYVSNWSLKPGQQPASPAVHIIAAPPRTTLATLTLHF